MTSREKPIQFLLKTRSYWFLGVFVCWPSPEDPSHGWSSGHGHLQSQEEERWSLCTDCEPGLYLRSLEGQPSGCWFCSDVLTLSLVTKVCGGVERWNSEELLLWWHSSFLHAKHWKERVLTHEHYNLHTLSLSFAPVQASMHCTRELIQGKTIGGFLGNGCVFQRRF